MPLEESRQQLIREAVEAGRAANRQASGRVTLPVGNKRYVTLARGGKLTPEGAFHRTLVPETQGAHGLGADGVVRPNNGNREYLQTRGKRIFLRSKDEHSGVWNYSRFGQRYFSQHELHEYVVHVPVLITTYDGRQQGRTRVDYLPWSKFGQNILQSQLGTEAERKAQVVRQVKQGLGVERQGDVVMEISGERYTLNEDHQEWGLVDMGTKAEDGHLVTSVHASVLARPEPQRRLRQVDQPLGHRRCAPCSHLPFPDELLEEAFEQRDDRLCVPRQLCRLLGCSFEHLCGDFDVFLGDWRLVGITSVQIMEFLQDKGVPYHCFAEEHFVWTCAEPQHPGVAWTVHDGHAWFYRHGRALEKWRPATCQANKALKGEHETETPPISEWQVWQNEPAVGYFWTVDLRAARRQLLESGRSPKVSLKSLCSWAALRYRCVQAVDGCSGWCVIRELPEDDKDTAVTPRIMI